MKLKSTLLLGAFTSALLAGACDSGAKKDDAKAEAKAEEKKEEAKAEEKPADAEAEAEPAAEDEKEEEAKAEDEAPAEGGGGADEIGIPECDEYITKYAACIDAKLPDAAKEATQKSLQDSVKAWKAVAEGPGKDTLAETCKTALETAKKATSAMGCEW